MNKILGLVFTFSLFLQGFAAEASPVPDSYDVFIPIAKYIRAGDAERLSVWFADNLEITVFSKTSDSSRAQAKQIVRSFFQHYAPRSFEITHTAQRSNMKYAIGVLSAGDESFAVTIFVSLKGSSYSIQQLKIEKID